MVATDDRRRTPALLGLAWRFLGIGAVAFGGLGATLALIEADLVRRRAVLSRDDVTEALTYTKLLPGSTVVQIVAYLGWRLGGWPGSAVATIAFIVPSAVAMVALSYGYSHVAGVPVVTSALHGLLAAVVGLLMTTLYRLARPVLRTPLTAGLAVAAFAVVLLFHINPVWVVLGAGLLGVALERR